MGFAFSFGSGSPVKPRLRETLLKHFGLPGGEIATAARQFSITSRVDIQSALEELLRNRSDTKLFGIVSLHGRHSTEFAHLLAQTHLHLPIDLGPLQI